MLEHPRTLTELAEKTELAKSYVLKVIEGLKKQGLVWGNLETHPELLVREWGVIKRRIWGALKPLRLDVLVVDRIKNCFSRYVISGPFAEMLVQGQSPGRPVILYTTQAEFEQKREQILGLGRIGKGQLWVYVYDEHVFTGSWVLRGWRVASIPQISADMIALGTYSDAGIDLLRRWLRAGGRV